MDDLEFIQRCVKGDKRAWDEFVDKYSRLIYSYIHSVIKLKGITGINQDTIGDLFQEISLSLIEDNFKKLKGFKAKNGCSLASWLRHITINRTIDYIRTLKPLVSIEAEDDWGLSLKEILRDESLTAAQKLTEGEKLLHLKECIEKLDKQEKYFLRLHIDKGVELKRLKGYFRISRAALDMRKLRIVEKLRECFKSKGFIVK